MAEHPAYPVGLRLDSAASSSSAAARSPSAASPH